MKYHKSRKPNRQPRAGARTFDIYVTPTEEALFKSIAAGGNCDPNKCWHRVAILCVFDGWHNLSDDPHVRVDAGHVQANYEGWRYIADTPHHTEISLLKFDKERYDELKVKPYTLTFRRTTPIVRMTRDRQDRINETRRARVAAGGNEYRRSYNSMRKRVEGFSSVV